MKEIDITGEKFDFVDYSEGNIFFEKFAEGEEFQMKIWGATLMSQLGVTEKDSYVASVSDLIFEDVSYIVMDYGIYADAQGTEFVNNMEDKNTRMQLQLGKNQITSSYKEYVLGGILGRNIGYAEIKIYCKGLITLVIDENTLIDATDFCLNTEKYSFGNRKITGSKI